MLPLLNSLLQVGLLNVFENNVVTSVLRAHLLRLIVWMLVAELRILSPPTDVVGFAHL